MGNGDIVSTVFSLAEKGSTDVGVIGAGSVATTNHLPILSNSRPFNIKYIADIEYESAFKLSNKYSASAIDVSGGLGCLPDSDIVLLAIPLGVREPYYTEFADRGIPIFTEKPFAVQLNKYVDYIEKIDKIYCNYMRTCYSSTRQLKDIVDEGLFGEVERIIVREEGRIGSTGLRQSHYQTDPELSGGGIIAERGCHLLSQLVFVFESCEFNINRVKIRGNKRLETHVELSVDLIKDEQSYEIELCMSSTEFCGNVFKIVFENATVWFNQTDAGSRLRVKPKNSDDVYQISVDDRWAQTGRQAMYLKWHMFLSKIVTDHTPAPDVETGEKVTSLISEIYSYK